MSKVGLRNDLWDTVQNWMERVHGQNLKKNQKESLNFLLHHLDILLDEIASLLEENFVPLDIEAIDKAGLVPLLIPEKLCSSLGISYILQSEAIKEFSSLVDPTQVKKEVIESSDEGNIDDEGDSSCNDETFEDEDEDSESVFNCSNCDLTFDSYDDLLDHHQTCESVPDEEEHQKKTKNESKKLKKEDPTCKTCSRTFASFKYLKYSHSKICKGTSSASTSFSCPNCDKKYKTESHYYLHTKTCGQDGSSFEKVDSRRISDIFCSKCGFIANSKEEFLESNHTCEPVKRFKCMKCDFKTCYQGSLRNHYGSFHPKENLQYVCDICGAIYAAKIRFSRHLKSHFERPSKIPCPNCGKIFSCSFSLKRHSEICNKPAQEHPCEICGKTYSTLYYLKRHITSQHPKSGQLKKHECIHCHSFFREKAYLRKHIAKKHSKT